MASIRNIVRDMDDEALARKELELRREIPVAQSLLSAIKRERIRRKRLAKKANDQKTSTFPS
jgi:hypothetical protein